MPESIRTIGIVGHGAFGALLETMNRRFAPDIEIRITSSKSQPDGVRFFSFGDTAACDAVILAVPIHAFEETLKKVLLLARQETVLIDVATVKTHTARLLKTLAAKRPYVAAHPMFGPESYAKQGADVNGFRIVITEHTLPPAAIELLISFLKDCGFTLLEMSGEDHDKHLAETLFLTHFVGQTIARAGFDRTAIDTVSFGYLMNAVESVRNDTALFKDVYHFNPYCEEILKRFGVAESEVHALLKTES